jgi:hypothetical protein
MGFAPRWEPASPGAGIPRLIAPAPFFQQEKVNSRKYVSGGNLRSGWGSHLRLDRPFHSGLRVGLGWVRLSHSIRAPVRAFHLREH